MDSNLYSKRSGCYCSSPERASGWRPSSVCRFRDGYSGSSVRQSVRSRLDRYKQPRWGATGYGFLCTLATL